MRWHSWLITTRAAQSTVQTEFTLEGGIFLSKQAPGAHARTERRFEPMMSPDQAATLMRQWERAVQQTVL